MASTGTTFDSDCGLMLHLDGADASTTFTDSSFVTPKTPTAVGNAQLDTAQSKFGGASLLLDGTGDYVTIADSSDWDFGTGDFTIDFQVRFNSLAAQQYLFSRQTDAIGNGTDLLWSTDNFLTLYIGNSTVMARAFTPSTGTWYHIAVIRTGSTCRIFVDGTQIGTDGTNSTDINYAQPFSIGAFDFAGGLSPVNGWIDEFRIVKGTAVWTANFTAPTAAYTQAGGGTTNVSRMMLMGIG